MKKSYTMIEWMATVFVMAVLSAISFPIYRSWVFSAYESRILKALSAVKVAQDNYYLEHKQYAGKDKLHAVTEDFGLGVPGDDYPAIQRVNYDNIVISVNYPESNEFLIVWIGDDGDVPDSFPLMMAMDHKGEIFRSEREAAGSRIPKLPHLQD